jgi:hypothetical protein
MPRPRRTYDTVAPLIADALSQGSFVPLVPLGVDVVESEWLKSTLFRTPEPFHLSISISISLCHFVALPKRELKELDLSTRVLQSLARQNAQGEGEGKEIHVGRTGAVAAGLLGCCQQQQ